MPPWQSTSTSRPRIRKHRQCITATCILPAPATQALLPRTLPNRTVRWLWASLQHRCHLQTTGQFRSRTCTPSKRCGQDSGRPPWNSNRAESQRQSRELQATSTPTNPSGYSQARLTTHRPLMESAWSIRPRDDREGGAAELSKVDVARIETSSETWRNGPSKKVTGRVRGAIEALVNRCCSRACLYQERVCLRCPSLPDRHAVRQYAALRALARSMDMPCAAMLRLWLTSCCCPRQNLRPNVRYSGCERKGG